MNEWIKDFSNVKRTEILRHSDGYEIHIEFNEEETIISSVSFEEKKEMGRLAANGFDELIAKIILKNREEMRKE